VHGKPATNRHDALRQTAIPFVDQLWLSREATGLHLLNSSILIPIFSQNCRECDNYLKRVQALARLTHCKHADWTHCSEEAVLVSGQIPSGRSIEWNTVPHAIYKGPVLSRRRNHHVLLDVAKQRHLSVGRRYAGDVESYDLQTGNRRRYPSEYLNIHHVGAAIVDAIEVNGSRSGRQEMWILCGAEGEMIDTETPAQYTRIVDLRTMVTRLGPQVDQARSGCLVEVINYTNVNGVELELLCSIGGNTGSHRHGILVSNVSCFDRALLRWIKLPNTLEKLDHHNIGIIDYTSCPVPTQRPLKTLVEFNGRPLSYSQPTCTVYELPLLEERLRSGLINIEGWQWQRSFSYDGRQGRAGGGGVVVSKRYLVSAGGIRHNEQISLANMLIIDMCHQRTCIPPIGHFVHHFAAPLTWEPGSHTIHSCAGQVIGSPLFKYRDGDGSGVDPTVATSRSLSANYCEVWSMAHLLQSCEVHGLWTDGLPASAMSVT
jgi:hypothetical protein